VSRVVLPILREEKVDWLLALLQSYPGSRWGNRETRGLDTEFASETYVKTELEETLYRDIRERRIRLVVLCGNAGAEKRSSATSRRLNLVSVNMHHLNASLKVAYRMASSCG